MWRVAEIIDALQGKIPRLSDRSLSAVGDRIGIAGVNPASLQPIIKRGENAEL